MPRIEEVDPAATAGRIAKVLELQASTWGAPLANHLIYARRPALFKGVRGMWAALDQDGHLGEPLICLVNRRIARLNACTF